MTYEHDQHNWAFVESALQEGTFSGFKMAIIESEKIFQRVIKESGFKKTALMKELAKMLSGPETFYRARLMAEKIMLEPNFEISREDAKRIIAAYWRGIRETNEWLEGLGWFERQFLRMKHVFPAKKNFIALAIAVLALMLLIQFLALTDAGRRATTFIAAWNDFLFWKVVIAAGTGAVLYIGLKFAKVYLKQR